MRPALQGILDALLRESEDARSVTLDQIGEAFGTEVASTDDIEAVLTALEERGRAIVSPKSGDVQSRLHLVLATVRALVASTGRKPTPAEIAEAAELDESSVRTALMLGRVMGR